MKRKWFISVIVILSAALLLVGCGGEKEKDSANTEKKDTGTSEETFTLKVGNTVSEKDPFNVAYNEFKTAVEEASDGRIQVEVFPNGSIGETDADVLEKVRANTLQMGNTTPNCLAALANMNEYYVYGIPYLMSTDEELNTVGESEWLEGLNEDFRTATGVKIFSGGGVNMGWFGFSSTDSQIDKLDDLKGMSIRINQTNQMIALTENAGINPQFIAFSEVYTALAQGTVDGMVTNMPLFYSNGFYDQLKSILSTHCGESYHFYIINDNFYNSLPEDLQLILDEKVAELITRTRELEEGYLDEAIGVMEDAGVTITEASTEDEETLRKIAIDKIWSDETNSLTSLDHVKKVLEILGRSEEL